MTWQDLEPSIPHRNGVPVDLNGEEQFANDQYVVTRRIMSSDNPEAPAAMHLSIRRQDRQPCRDWRDFQRIKNQLAGPEWEGVELYPAESRKVDGANHYHLFVFDMDFGIGFNKRIVANQYQSAKASPGSVQRDPEKVDLMYGGLSKMKDILDDNPAYDQESA